VGIILANISTLTQNDSQHIVRLRLVIARAGQSDSMRWWADESLTPDATFLLGRLFPRSIEQSRRRLALQSARARHHAELAAIPGARHLFDLGDDIEFQIAQITDRDAPAHYPPAPITSLDELNVTLAHIIGTSSAPMLNGSQNGRVLEIDVDDNLPSSQVAERLAWSYLQSATGAPIFPYFREQR
jgi:hypothetical protein